MTDASAELMPEADLQHLQALEGQAAGTPLKHLIRPRWKPFWQAAVMAGLFVWGLSQWVHPQLQRLFSVEQPVEATAPVFRLVELPTMVFLQGDTFKMGSDRGDGDEQPTHDVTIPSFEISKTEVTVAQYAACVNEKVCPEPVSRDEDDLALAECNWGDPSRNEHPMNCISWQEAKTFVKWAGVRLPGEAEWEFAARSGGFAQEYPWGDQEPDCDLARIESCGSATAPVCSTPKGNTQQGLCDMAGNLWEWVEDDWHDSYSNAPKDQEPWIDRPRGSYRVNRGGSWWNDPQYTRVAIRGWRRPSSRSDNLGFRVARSLPSAL